MFRLICVLFTLIINGFSQDVPGCEDMMLTDCDRNYCKNQIVEGMQGADICQLACKLAQTQTDSCKSWAYSTNYGVKYDLRGHF